MPESCRNIYKNARRAAGISQERAAERLGLSVESVRAYETGQRIPPNHIVLDMSVKYNALYLCYDHMQATDEIFAKIVPALSERDAVRVCVQICNRVNRLSGGKLARFLEIFEDGVVDDSEQAEYSDIRRDLKGIAKGFMEMDVLVDAMKKGDPGGE